MQSEQQENVTQILKGINFRNKPYRGVLIKVARSMDVSISSIRARMVREDPETVKLVVREAARCRKAEADRKKRARKYAGRIAE